MKRIKNIYIYTICSLAIFVNSCQELDDFEPIFSLPAESTIVDEASAEIVLNGIYAGFGSRSGLNTAVGLPKTFIIPSLLSGLGTAGINFPNAEALSLEINQPQATESPAVHGSYTELYQIINRANWLIQETPKVPDFEFDNLNRKTEIVAEAKAIRATANFYLLRLWGQFYDMSSSYGINIRTSPATSDQAFPRNTVAESYNAILQDLDDAIANAPNFRTKSFTSKTYAKALKARVLLYKGNYIEASTLAKDVIENSGSNFVLAPNYTGIFDNSSNALFNSNEIIFATQGENDVAPINIGREWRTFAYPSISYLELLRTGTVSIGSQTISYDGGEVESLFLTEAENQADPQRRISSVFKYAIFLPTFGENWEMIYHMRMAEMYLILAEADARANNMVTIEALDALNAVRIRRGATTTGGSGFEIYPSSISYSQFLEAVRIEKKVELGAEIGEEWFDMVRYHFIDGFDITSVKPEASNPDKFILPISQESIEIGGGIVEQNPSY